MNQQVVWMALATCLAGCEASESEVTRLQHGCVAADGGVPDPCCTPCRSEVGEECDDTLLEFPNEARARREFESLCDDGTGGFGYLSVGAGQCSSGVRFLSMANGNISETRYFDTSGDFIGLFRTSDYVDAACRGIRYFPEVIPCEAPVSEELCYYSEAPL